jgi:polyhydroxyalkanoate synthesis repressor PhaR
VAARVPDPGPRLIKRYDNRKLYDASRARYVTIEDIAALIASGEEVEVRDQGTGEDITTVVLAQVILDGVKERTASIPRQVLTRLNRLGSGPDSAWAEWEGPHDAAARARAEADRLAASVQRILADAQTAVESGLRHLMPTAAPAAAGRRPGRRRAPTRRPARPPAPTRTRNRRTT